MFFTALLFLMQTIVTVSQSLPSVNLTNSSGVNSSECIQYGHPPATRTHTVDGLFDIIQLCKNISGYAVLLNFTDNNGEQRAACLLITSLEKSLPLLVWLHGSLSPPSTILFINLVPEAYTTNLPGTMNGPLGYHLLIPSGRDTTHIYPKPIDQGLGWDNWYRNYNRSDPTFNVDVQAIVHFIDQVLQNQTEARVDYSRVFMCGWSNGAAMALEYALNTLGIAAAAVYSAPNAYRDYEDPRAQTPYPAYFTSILDLHNQCDIANNCVTGKQFIDDLNNRYPNQLTAEIFIIDSLLHLTSACDLNCTSIILGLGPVQHFRWPVTYNQLFFDFSRNHPLY